MSKISEIKFIPKKRRVIDIDTGEILELNEIQSVNNENVIYKLTHLKSKKAYIGKSVWPIKRRVSSHHVFKKHGKPCEFSLEILYEVREKKGEYVELKNNLRYLEAFEIEIHDAVCSGLNRMKPNPLDSLLGAEVMGYLPKGSVMAELQERINSNFDNQGYWINHETPSRLY